MVAKIFFFWFLHTTTFFIKVSYLKATLVDKEEQSGK
jgi:hypothetical protein